MRQGNVQWDAVSAASLPVDKVAASVVRVLRFGVLTRPILTGGGVVISTGVGVGVSRPILAVVCVRLASVPAGGMAVVPPSAGGSVVPTSGDAAAVVQQQGRGLRWVTFAAVSAS